MEIDEYEDGGETNVNESFCDAPDSSLIVFEQEPISNSITEQIMDLDTDDTPMLFPLDDFVLQPFESDIIIESDSVNFDIQYIMLPSTSKNIRCNINNLSHEIPSKTIILSQSEQNKNRLDKHTLLAKPSTIAKKTKYSTRNKNKAIRTVVKRQIDCNMCKKKFPVHAPMAKCMACKELNCMACSSNEEHFDYICLKCFGA